jgi:hypothetical protein
MPIEPADRVTSIAWVQDASRFFLATFAFGLKA